MTKQKWYKSKGGWFGGILSIILMFLTINNAIGLNKLLIPIFTPAIYLSNLVINNIIKCSGESCMGYALFFGLPFIAIYGFIIGYFIEKWFFRRRK